MHKQPSGIVLKSDDPDEPITDPDAICRKLKEWWETVWTHKPCDLDALHEGLDWHGFLRSSTHLSDVGARWTMLEHPELVDLL